MRLRAQSIVSDLAHAHVLNNEPHLKRSNTLPKTQSRPRRHRRPTEWHSAESAADFSMEPLLGVSISSFDEGVFSIVTQESQVLLDSACSARRECDRALSDAATILEGIEILQKHMAGVVEQMNSIQSSSQETLAKQTHLHNLATNLDSSLAHYDRLDLVTKELSKPLNRVVGKPKEFLKLLDQIDDGLQFCAENPSFDNMDLYRLRYQQCLTRALSMCLDYCVCKLKDKGDFLSGRLTTAGSNEAACTVLIWTKFQQDLEYLKPLTAALSARNQQDQNIFPELATAYFDVRRQLLANEINRYLSTIYGAPVSKRLDAVSTVLVHFQQLYDRETKVYSAIIGSPEDLVLESGLIDLSENLYDALRTYVLREADIAKLCAMSVTLQGVSEWQRVLEPITGDVQNRLVFKSDALIDGIERYKPKDSDFDPSPMSFPPVQRTLELLGQVNQLMNQKLFDDVANNCILKCLHSVELAAKALNRKRGVQDASLFQIQQLVLLQTQIMSYELDKSVEYDIDFTGFQLAITSIRTRRPSLSELVSLAKASMPHVVEHIVNAMGELYNYLQKAVERFTEHRVSVMCEPICAQQWRSADADTRRFREVSVEEYLYTRKLISVRIQDAQVVDALLDKIYDEMIKVYTEYYTTIYQTGSPDQVEGILDVDAFATWFQEEVRRFEGAGNG